MSSSTESSILVGISEILAKSSLDLSSARASQADQSVTYPDRSPLNIHVFSTCACSCTNTNAGTVFVCAYMYAYIHGTLHLDDA